MQRRQRNQKKIVLFLAVTILSVLVGCDSFVEENTFFEKKESLDEIIELPDGSIVYPDGTMKLAEGSVSYGFYDANGNLMQTGDTLVVTDELIHGMVSFQQNIPEETIEYSLIILIDYIQNNFSVDGKSYSNYSFSLKEEDIINIEFELSNFESAKTLTILFVTEPNLTELTFDTKEGRNDLFQTASSRTITCYLNEQNVNEKKLDFCEEMHSYDQNSSNLFITKDLEEQRVMTTCNSGDKVKILFGNSTEYEKKYVMLAFVDWEQSTIDGEPYKLFKLDAEQGYYYDLIIPNVNETSSYQIFMIENPFSPSLRDWSLGSLRTIIKSD